MPIIIKDPKFVPGSDQPVPIPSTTPSTPPLVPTDVDAALVRIHEREARVRAH